MTLAWLWQCFSRKKVEKEYYGSCGDQAMCKIPEVTVAIEKTASDVLRGFLQQALCNASQEKLVECRAKALVKCLRYHLDAKIPVVRLYGLAEEGIGKVMFVLLASAADTEDEKPGSYIISAPALKHADGRTQMQDMLYEAFSKKVAVTSVNPGTSAVCVALPLLIGEVISSILWIQHQPASPDAVITAGDASATATVRSDRVLCISGAAPGDYILRCPPVLQQLALSASVILAAGVPDAPEYFNLLSLALRRLADCMTLKALVAELCGILAAHVRRNFLLDAAIRAAVVPVAGSQLAFLLGEDAQSARAAGGGAGAGLVSATVMPIQGQVALAAATLLANASCDTHTVTLGGGGDSVCGNGGRNATSGINLTYSGPQAIMQVKLDAFGSRGRRGSCYEGTSVLGQAAAAPGGGKVRDTGQRLRRSSSEMNLAKAAARTPSLQPLRRPTGYAGVLSPDTPPNSCRGRAPKCCMPNGGSHGGRMRLTGTGNAVGGCGAGPEGCVASGAFSTVTGLAELRAKPFRLSETVLQQMVLQSGALEGGNVCGNADGNGDRYRSSGVLTGEVVPDCLQYVQSLRLPSRDVYMLLNAAAVREATAVGTLYDSHGTCGSPSSSVRSRLPALGLAAATTGGSTGGGASATPSLTAKSLTLVGVTTEDGAVLGLYVSFPFSLPPHMLEAIQNSCADLLAAVLAPILRRKLREQCASELETLAAGVPGSYVIVPSSKAPSVPPTMTGLRPSTMGLLNLTTGGPSVITTTAATGGEGTASVDGSNSQPTQQQPADGEREPNSPTVSEPLMGLVQPTLSVNQAGARTAGLLGTATAPPPAVSVRTAYRNSTHASPARQRLLCLWEGSGDTSAQMVSSGGGGLGQTTSGMSRCGGAASTLGMVASTSLAASGVGLLRRDTGPTEQLQGAMEMLSNDAALLTLLEADCEGTARVQLSVLVESIMSTLRDSTISPGVEDLYDVVSLESRPRGVVRHLSDDLDELNLTAMLGTGASGVVLMGKLATVPVAVKLMELPEGAFSDGGNLAKSTHDKEDEGHGGDGGITDGGKGVGPPAPPRQKTQKTRVEARRTLLRSATELAVLRSVSHINIVQVYAVYNNVFLDRVNTDQDEVSYKLSYRRRGEVHNMHDPDECPPCVAVCMELADCGSLEGVLAQRTFPRWYHRKPAGVPSEGFMVLDFEGVYLTLLEIALALRHLHSRRLVHRDLKPANILLKSNSSDPRGWNCKLADFGFALVLDQQRPVENCPGVMKPCTVQEQACGTVTHMAPETLRPGAQIDASVDMFSLGVIMWEMVAGRGYRPYVQMAQDEIPPAVLEGMRPIFPDGLVPSQYRKMAQSCWSSDPQTRPTAADIVTFAKEQLEHLSGQVIRRRVACGAR
ncbi:hypothetical protein Vretimale_15231 [Volvox reticuliferus]|uniref:Protein kinase domain-containing protein n=1 Tax=Volvox reticuliferus TaxID=1737510 RepID=A0A8J4LUU0_9CHLO|nr:hypothetical protein Vretimale_15231 [Volvox reticuliferus]